MENPDGVTIDSLRRWLFIACFARGFLMIVVACTFWTGAIWIIAYPAVSLVVTVLGIVHLSSMDQLHHSQCCCGPRPAILTLYTSAVILACVGLVAAMQSLISILTQDGKESIIFRAVCGGAALVAVVIDLVFAARCKHLKDKIEAEEALGIARNQIAPEMVVMRYPDPYQQGAADNGQVYYGVPMRVQMTVASLPAPSSAAGGVMTGNVLAGSPCRNDVVAPNSDPHEYSPSNAAPPFFTQPPTALGYNND